MSCEGCYRLINDHFCEAFKDIPKGECWAKQTDKVAYIKEKRELAAYNEYKSHMSGVTQAEASIRRVGW